MTGVVVPNIALIVGLGIGQYESSSSPPIPGAKELRERAIVSLKRSEKELEKYACLVQSQTDDLKSNGTVKRHRSKLSERFFVNGIEIEHVLERDGRRLDANAATREQQRVDKEVKKYSDPAQARKAKADQEKQTDLVVRALLFKNGAREVRDGRSTVVYDMEGDPDFHPTKVEERFAQALSGRILLDEATGTPVEMRAETKRDIKLGGGLLANVHKGFQIHLVQQLEPGDAWILKTIEGNLDARAALFLRPRIRFREDLQKCHIFSVETEQHIKHPPPGATK